jgi:hypothetical protein
MKKWGLTLAALFVFAPLFAQSLPEFYTVAGKWSFADGRLYQSDETARLAKVNLRVPQAGPMVYEFNARYEGGGEDGHGGFGIHLFAENVDTRPRNAWGSGNSYLLWLNYDENPSNPQIPAGLSAQIYRSYNNSGDMRLLESVDLNEYAENVTDEDLDYPVNFVIRMDGNTGEIRVYDPTDETGTAYFYYNIDKRDLPRKGSWVTLRTNGVKISFGQ